MEIPIHNPTEHLDLCLQSAIEGQTNKNQIIITIPYEHIRRH